MMMLAPDGLLCAVSPPSEPDEPPCYKAHIDSYSHYTSAVQQGHPGTTVLDAYLGSKLDSIAVITPMKHSWF